MVQDYWIYSPDFAFAHDLPSDYDPVGDLVYSPASAYVEEEIVGVVVAASADEGLLRIHLTQPLPVSELPEEAIPAIPLSNRVSRLLALYVERLSERLPEDAIMFPAYY